MAVTVPGTTVVDAVSYIFGQLSAMPNVFTATSTAPPSSNPIQLCWDVPPKFLASDVIAVASRIQQTAEHHANIGTGGTGAMMEDYRIDIKCSSYRGTTDPAVTMAAAEVLSNMVDTAVRADPSLGGAVLAAWPVVHDWSTDPSESPAGFVTDIDIAIAVSAQI